MVAEWMTDEFKRRMLMDLKGCMNDRSMPIDAEKNLIDKKRKDFYYKTFDDDVRE